MLDETGVRTYFVNALVDSPVAVGLCASLPSLLSLQTAILGDPVVASDRAIGLTSSPSLYTITHSLVAAVFITRLRIVSTQLVVKLVFLIHTATEEGCTSTTVLGLDWKQKHNFTATRICAQWKFLHGS